MSQFIKKVRCNDCDSNDNLAIFKEDNGQFKGFCYTPSCGKKGFRDSLEAWETGEPSAPRRFMKDEAADFDEDNTSLPYGTEERRKVSSDVCEAFGVRVAYDSNRNVSEVHYPYPSIEGDQTSWKIRKCPKEFRVSGGLEGVKLFGQAICPSNQKRTLVVTEGEEDTLAIAQAYKEQYKKLYPVVSIPSASGFKAVSQNLEFIQGYDEVILWMDQDAAGQAAIEKLTKMIGYGKCKIVTGDEKDASDTLVNHGYNAVLQGIWNAKPFNPRGILRKEGLRKAMKEYAEKVSVPYPECFQGLNNKTKGIRTGEITLFTSGTGAGKSTIVREVAYDLLKKTDDLVGIIALEESPAETTKKLSMLAINTPSSEEVSEELLDKGFEDVFGDDRVLVLDHQGAITESLTSQLHFMASAGCKYIIIDHITILASEGINGLSGNEAVDKIMNELLEVVKVHDVWIGLISHLRKSDKAGKSFEQGNMPSLDDIKGSGAIKQISMDVIAFSRNSEEGQNEIKMRVLKCRYTGKTGDAGAVRYDNLTGRLELSDLEGADGEDFESFG